MSARYITVEEVKNVATIDGDDQRDDTNIERAIGAAAGAVEGFCRGRRFTLDDEEDVERLFTVHDSCHLELVPDLVSITALETDTTGDGTFDRTWEETEYRLLPLNADKDGRPWEEIATLGSARFPYGLGRVRITGAWGWPTVPDEVKQATLLVAVRLLKRTKDAPMGFASAGIDGVAVRLLARMDADGEVMLRHLAYAGTVG